MTTQLFLGPLAGDSKVLAFVVPGEPQAWQRPTTVVRDGKVQRTYTPTETIEYEATVRAHAMRAAALAKWPRAKIEDRFALALELRLSNARHKDVSNITKSVEDGLQPAKGEKVGGIILDDWQICRLTVLRVLRCSSPGVLVRIWRTTESEES
jgi:Holliday junction resolvase RusA-like endonuclease